MEVGLTSFIQDQQIARLGNNKAVQIGVNSRRADLKWQMSDIKLSSAG